MNGSKHCSSNKISLEIPAREKFGVIEIKTYTVKSLTEIPENNIRYPNNLQEWKIANYNHNIENEVLHNAIPGGIDVIFGRDNLGKLLLEDTIIRPFNKCAIRSTKVGWKVGGNFHKHPHARWQRIKSKVTILSSKNSIRTTSLKAQDSQIEAGLTKVLNNKRKWRMRVNILLIRNVQWSRFSKISNNKNIECIQ